MAALNDRKDVVEFLIKEGKANVNAVDKVSCFIQSINHKSYSVQQREELTMMSLVEDDLGILYRMDKRHFTWLHPLAARRLLSFWSRKGERM